MKSRPEPVEEQLEEIRQACGGVRPPKNGNVDRLFMTWSELGEMANNGMNIGSHTHTHRLLGYLSATEQEKELSISKDILEARLARKIMSVAYPIGSQVAYSQETCAIAAKLGYRWGFNFLRRTNKLPIHNPLDMSRFAVSENHDCATLQSIVCFPRLFA